MLPDTFQDRLYQGAFDRRAHEKTSERLSVERVCGRLELVESSKFSGTIVCVRTGKFPGQNVSIFSRTEELVKETEHCR